MIGPELVAQADDLKRRMDELDLKRRMSELKEERERVTSQLEGAARQYRPGGTCCGRGRFIYLGAELGPAGQGIIRFGTRCFWHANDDGPGLAVPLVYLEPYLAEVSA